MDLKMKVEMDICKDEYSENVEMRQDGVADCPDHHQHHQPQQEQQLAPGHSAL